jgi:hypothetical protein
MAIEKIPDIKAASFGGFIFDISFSRNFSTEPSKVTIKIVNYKTTPQIGSAFSLRVGSFSFNGRIQSYEIEEGSSGKILSVSIIDNSIILDKIYVLVFRSGFFGELGSAKNVDFNVFFDNEHFYTFNPSGGLTRNSYINGNVKREVRGLSKGKFFGDILMVGEEEPPDNRCEIPNCSYTFDQLIEGASEKVRFDSVPGDSKLKQTYEGSLRSVLSSWCQDLGYSFYWDYKNDRLMFFDLKNDVFNLSGFENLTDKKITNKRVSYSSDGCFNQVGLSYVAQPFEPASDSANLSRTFNYPIYYSHVPLSYLLRRDEQIVAAQNQLNNPGGASLDKEYPTLYGGARSSSNFWISAALGYAAPSLRKIYLYSWISSYGPHTGMKGVSSSGDLDYVAVSGIAKAMNLSGFSDDLKDMMSLAGETNQDNIDQHYVAFFCAYDQGLEEKWNDLEQSIFTQDYGSYYISTNTRSGSFSFCSPTSISTCSVQVNPEPSRESDSDKTSGDPLKRPLIWNRGAPGPSKTQEEISNELYLSAWSTAIEKLLPRQIPLKDQGDFVANLRGEGLIIPPNADTLFIIPRSQVISDHLQFDANSYFANNDRETTYLEVANSNNQSCQIKDQNENKCLSAKEELKLGQFDPDTYGAEQEEIATGLSNKMGKGVIIRLGGQTSRFVSSSAAPFRASVSFTNSVQSIFDKTKKKKITFSGNSSFSDSSKIYETRVFVDNRTDFDAFSKEEISSDEMAKKKTYTQLSEAKTVSITSAGFIDSISLSPNSGLSSFGLNISDSGFSVTYEFASRPKSFPSDDFIRKGTSLNQPKTVGRFFSREIS